MKPVDISVIIPVYNVEEYLEECLDCLLCQGNVALQVILVDDGSKDGSGSIAERYCEKHPGFEYHRVENGGPGRARNIGVRHAKGKYLAFLDADDKFADGTLEMMFSRAENDGSDVTIINVCHLDSMGSTESPLHKKVFSSPAHITHIRDDHRLLYDTTIWNKLILRSFYEDNRITWPEGMFYEDIPVATRIHYLANQVSVINKTGYYWRVRDGETRSTTQKLSEISNLKDRIKALTMVDEFFDNEVSEKGLNISKNLKALNTDLKLYIRRVPFLETKKAIEFMDYIDGYLKKSVNDDIFNSLKIVDRQLYSYLKAGDLDSILGLLSYTDYRNAPVKEENGRLYADLPSDLFVLPDRDVTDELCCREPVQKITSVELSQKSLEIYACFYYERINIENADEQQVKAFLYNEMTGAVTELSCEPFEACRLTETAGLKTDMSRKITSEYNYNGTGVKIKADLTDPELFRKHADCNIIVIELSNRFVSRSFMLSGGTEDVRPYDGLGRLISEHSVSISCSIPGPLTVSISEDPVVIETVLSDAKGTGVRLSREIDGLQIRGSKGVIEEAFILDKGTDYYLDPNINGIYRGSLYYTKKSGKRAVSDRVFARGKLAEIIRTGKNGLALSGIGSRGVQVISDDFSAVVSDVTKKDDGFAIDVAFYCEDPKPEAARLFVESSSRGQTELASAQLFEVEDGLKGTFDVNVRSGKVFSALKNGQKIIFAELFTDGSPAGKVRLYCAAPCVNTYKRKKRTVTIKRGGSLDLRLSASEESEKSIDSKEIRRSLIAKVYHGYLEEPLNKNEIVFKLSAGNNVKGSAGWEVCRLLKKYYPDTICVWTVKDLSVPAPAGAQKLQKGSEEYYSHLATAGALITDIPLPGFFQQREGQVLVDMEEITSQGNNGDTKKIFKDIESKVIRDKLKIAARRLRHRI